jgi:hypothetical protein
VGRAAQDGAGRAGAGLGGVSALGVIMRITRAELRQRQREFKPNTGDLRPEDADNGRLGPGSRSR